MSTHATPTKRSRRGHGRPTLHDVADAAGVRVRVLRAGTGDAFDSGRKVLDLLRTPARPAITAAAFANDHLACGALMQAQSDGVVVPDELALLGFGDFPLGRQMRPSLSTVRPPSTEIGRAAAEAVLQAMASKTEVVSRSLEWVLIPRHSTGSGPG